MSSSLLKGALLGCAAGLIASLMMEQAQSLLQNGEGGGDGESATTKAADRVALATAGAPVPKPQKSAAGELVHDGFGAAVGAAYGAAAAAWPPITSGFGAPFGLAVAVIADDGLVPALGLGPGPTQTDPKTHAYSLASHLVFGLSLEGARRLLDRAL